MSFHGGFLGVVIAVILFSAAGAASHCCSATSRRRSIWPATRRPARHLINAELRGRPTDVPWAMAVSRWRARSRATEPAV